jgi:hypothetical protein
MRVRVLASLVGMLLGSVAFSRCSDATAPASTVLTSDPFFIRGSITETGHPWGTLVRGEGSPPYPVTAAFFTVGPATVIQHADGSAASVADLTVGRELTLWITGAILKSLPPQVGARLIVIK